MYIFYKNSLEFYIRYKRIYWIFVQKRKGVKGRNVYDNTLKAGKNQTLYFYLSSIYLSEIVKTWPLGFRFSRL